MTRSSPTWLFPALAVLGALLVLVALIQHFVLQMEVLHLALYVFTLGIVLVVVGVIGFFVVPSRNTKSTS